MEKLRCEELAQSAATEANRKAAKSAYEKWGNAFRSLRDHEQKCKGSRPG